MRFNAALVTLLRKQPAAGVTVTVILGRQG